MHAFRLCCLAMSFRSIFLLFLFFSLTISGCGSGSKNTEPQLESITISLQIESLLAGQTIKLGATGQYSNNENRDIGSEVMWKTSDDSIATISNEDEDRGLLTAIAPGEVYITATLNTIESEKLITIHMATWEKNFGNDVNMEARFVFQTSNGDFLIVGRLEQQESNWDVYAFMVDVFGDLIWEKAYGDAGDDMAKCAVEIEGEKYIIAGQTTVSDGTTDVYLLCVDNEGNVSWEETFGGQYEDTANSITTSSDGNLIIACSTQMETIPSGAVSGNGQDWNVSLLKIDKEGNLLWESIVGNHDNDYGYFNEKAQSVRIVSEGGLIIAGSTNIPSELDDPSGSGSDNLLLLRVDEGGGLIWRKVFGIFWTTDRGVDAMESQSGGFIVLAEHVAGGPFDPSCHVIKTDPYGELEWSEYYKKADRWGGMGYAITQAVDKNGYVIAGHNYSYCPEGVGYYIDLMKINEQGDLVWDKCYKTGTGISVQQTMDGGYIVVGKSGVVIKTDENGNVDGLNVCNCE